MPKTRTISAARKEFFELFDEVTSVEGHQVVIGRRNRSREAVLVAKDYLDHLEFTNRRGTRAPSQRRFSLYGSATLHVPPEQVLEASRREQAGAAAAKWRRTPSRAPAR